MNALTALVRLPQLRRKSALTIVLMALALGLARVPAPGVDASVVTSCAGAALPGVIAVANFFGGGALASLSVGAVGIMPFITASIILLLAGRFFAPAQRLMVQRGRRLLAVTSTLTFLLTAAQAAGFAFAAARPGGLLPGCPAVVPGGAWHAALAAGSMVAGTGALLAVGAAITRWGLGNGISLIIAGNVLSVLPVEVAQVVAERGAGTAVVAVALLVALLVGLVWLSKKTVPLPVTLTWRDAADPSRHRRLPMPLNPAGVMPLILGSVLASGPHVLDMVLPGQGWPAALARTVSAPGSGWHLLTIAVATIALTFYWVIVTWDAPTMATELADRGVTVDGPDDQDPAATIDALLLRTTTMSAALLGALAALPSIAVAALGTTARFPLGGATILVMVAIGLDTVRRIRADITAAQQPDGDPIVDQPAGPVAADALSDAELDEALIALGRTGARLV